MNIDAILEGLLTCKPNELKQIKARCVYILNKKKTGDEICINAFSDILYLNLRKQGRKIGLNNFQTLERASQLKPQAIDDFISKAYNVEIWINQHFDDYLKESTELREKFIAFLSLLYVGYIRSIFDSVNPWNLLACIDYLPQAFEVEFPEYIANNLQGVIVNKIIGNIT